MNRKTDDLGRIVIPIEIRKVLNIKNNDMLNIELIDDKIVLSKVEKEQKQMKDKFEVEQKLHNLKELINIGADDEKLLGSIETLEWILNPEVDKNDYLNDYDDIKDSE